MAAGEREGLMRTPLVSVRLQFHASPSAPESDRQGRNASQKQELSRLLRALQISQADCAERLRRSSMVYRSAVKNGFLNANRSCLIGRDEPATNVPVLTELRSLAG